MCVWIKVYVHLMRLSLYAYGVYDAYMKIPCVSNIVIGNGRLGLCVQRLVRLHGDPGACACELVVAIPVCTTLL